MRNRLQKLRTLHSNRLFFFDFQALSHISHDQGRKAVLVRVQRTGARDSLL